MARRKIVGAALFLTLFGAFVFLPPLVRVFEIDRPIAGLPAEAVFAFGVWAMLIVGAACLASALPHEDPPASRDGDK